MAAGAAGWRRGATGLQYQLKQHRGAPDSHFRRAPSGLFLYRSCQLHTQSLAAPASSCSQELLETRDMSEWRASLLAAPSLTKRRPLISSSDLPSGPGGSALMHFPSLYSLTCLSPVWDSSCQLLVCALCGLVQTFSQERST